MKTLLALLSLFLAIAAAASVAASLATGAPFNPMLALALLSSFASASLIAILAQDYAREPARLVGPVRKPVALPEPADLALEAATCDTISA